MKNLNAEDALPGKGMEHNMQRRIPSEKFSYCRPRAISCDPKVFPHTIEKDDLTATLEAITGVTALRSTAEKAKNSTYYKSPAHSPTTVLANTGAKPKRPLTAYNMFFRAERARLLGPDFSSNAMLCCSTKRRHHRNTNGKICFAALVKEIGKKWTDLDFSSKAIFLAQAAEDLKRYRIEMEEYNKMRTSGEDVKRGTSGNVEDKQKLIKSVCSNLKDKPLEPQDVCGNSRASMTFITTKRRQGKNNNITKPHENCVKSKMAQQEDRNTSAKDCAAFDSWDCLQTHIADQVEYNQEMRAGKRKAFIAPNFHCSPRKKTRAFKNISTGSLDRPLTRNSAIGPQPVTVFGRNIFEVD